MKTVRCVLISAVLLPLLVGTAFAGGTEERAAPEGPVEIEYWHDWAPEGAQGLVLQGLADEFNARFEGEIVLGLVYMGGRRDEKIAASLAAGDPPEVAWISGAGQSYYDAGVLISMDRVYDDIVDRADLLPNMREPMQYLGKDITLPHENSNLAVLYNRNLLREKGIAFPSAVIGEYTWDDFIRDAGAFTDLDAPTYGWHPRWATAMVWARFWQKGGQMFSDDFRTNLVVSDPEQQAAMLGALDWIDRTLYREPITANDRGDQSFGSSDMPFEITGPWALPRYFKPIGPFDPGDIGVAPFPADNETGAVVTYWYQKALAIFAKSERQEEAGLEFIKWFYSPEIHARWCADAGYLPVTRSALEHPVWIEYARANPWVEVYIEQTAFQQYPAAGIPRGDMDRMRDMVRFREGTPEQALRDYARDAQDVLDEFWATR